MANKIIVTNLRIPEDEWLQVKNLASSEGVSVNEYVRKLVNSESVKSMLGKKRVKSAPTGYEALLKLARSKTKGKPMGASEEDKIIYGIEDE